MYILYIQISLKIQNPNNLYSCSAWTPICMGSLSSAECIHSIHFGSWLLESFFRARLNSSTAQVEPIGTIKDAWNLNSDCTRLACPFLTHTKKIRFSPLYPNESPMMTFFLSSRVRIVYLWYLTPLSGVFQLYHDCQFIVGGNQSTRRKPPTCRKLLINLIT